MGTALRGRFRLSGCSGGLRLFGMPADQVEVGCDQSEALADPDVVKVATDQLIGVGMGPHVLVDLGLGECLCVAGSHDL